MQIKKSKGVALLCGMGTGKSLMIVSLVNIMSPKKTLIICPPSVVGVWPREFKSHSLNEFNVVALRDPSKKTPMSVSDKNKVTEQVLAQQDIREMKETIPDGKLGTVVVVNYESVWRDPIATTILDEHWDLIILDEMHKIKSPTSKSSKFIHKLDKNSDYRIGLTGTEQPHSPLDVWSQYRFLNSSVFGLNYNVFQKRYAVIAGKFNKVKEFINLSDMKRRMEQVSFRAGEEVLDLPEAVHIIVDTPLEGQARRLHAKIMEEMWVELEEIAIVANQHKKRINKAMLNTVITTQLIRCAQVTGGFVGGIINPNDMDAEPTIERITGGSKTQALKDIIDGMDKNEKMVVFCHFQEDLRQIEEIAEEADLRYGEISGRYKTGLTLDAKMNPDIDLVGVQLQSGGVGIDLTAARYCVYWNKSHDFGNYEQSLKRCHRPGQKNTVFFYHLITPDSVDERVEASLKNKEDVNSFFRKGLKSRMNEKGIKEIADLGDQAAE